MALLCLSALRPVNSRSISGTIYNHDSSQPIVGARARVKGTNLFTLADAEGHYIISIPDGKTQLIFSDTTSFGTSVIYYKADTLSITKANTLDAYLTQTMKMIIDTFEYKASPYRLKVKIQDNQ